MKISVIKNDDLSIDKKDTIMLDFNATWCAPCIRMSQVLEEMKDEEHDVTVIKINADQNQNLVSSYKVKSLPTIVFLKNGKEHSRHVGFKSKNQLIELFKSIKGDSDE